MVVKETSGRSDSVTFFRVLLAFLVVYSHSFSLLALDEPLASYGTSFGEIAVKGFFVLSGFLLCTSAINQNAIKFFGNRVTRIFPALFVSVISVSFVFSTLAALDEDWGTVRNLLSFSYTNISLVNPNRMFEVPGIFLNNPIPGVLNGSLWTITWEFWSYSLLYPLIRIPIRLRRAADRPKISEHTFIIGLLFFYTIGTFWVFKEIEASTGSVEYFLSQLFPCVLIGSLVRVLLESCHAIPTSRNRVWLCLVFFTPIFCFLIFKLNGSATETMTYFAMIVLVVIFSNLKLKLKNISRGLDPSYGIYLYAYPIQQTLIHLGIRDFYLHVLASLILSSIFGILSWLFIEKSMVNILFREIK
jgi:peptidoglycan/LPS O-acetylase OafA/YrhL